MWNIPEFSAQCRTPRPCPRVPVSTALNRLDRRTSALFSRFITAGERSRHERVLKETYKKYNIMRVYLNLVALYTIYKRWNCSSCHYILRSALKNKSKSYVAELQHFLFISTHQRYFHFLNGLIAELRMLGTCLDLISPSSLSPGSFIHRKSLAVSRSSGITELRPVFVHTQSPERLGFGHF